MAYARTARPLAAALGAVPVLVTWRRSVQCEEAKPKPTFQTAKCTSNKAHTSNTRLITLALPGNWNPNGAIANVMVRASIEGPAEGGCCACCKCPPPCGCPKQANGCCACCSCPGTCGCPKVVASATKETAVASTVARPYNPLSASSGSSVTLLVKKYEGAKMGTKLHSLQVNETVEVRGPNKQWTFESGKYKEYAMVAGGTGITPLIQASEHILANDSAKVTMLTFNKTPEDVLLRKELARLEVMYPGRFKVQHFVDSGACGTVMEGAPTSAAILKASLPPPGQGVLVMVCGRKEMTAAVAGPKTPDFKQGEVGGVLKDLGYSTEQVWKV